MECVRIDDGDRSRAARSHRGTWTLTEFSCKAKSKADVGKVQEAINFDVDVLLWNWMRLQLKSMQCDGRWSRRRFWCLRPQETHRPAGSTSVSTTFDPYRQTPFTLLLGRIRFYTAQEKLTSPE